MTAPLLALVMIVKDEAASIIRTLESCEEACDYFAILDTGSMDGTQEVIRNWRAHGRMADASRGSILTEEPFIDFAASRNRALDIARRAESPATFAISLSADETLRGGDALRNYLSGKKVRGEAAVCIRVEYGESRRFYYPHVLRLGGPWRFEGIVHEIPSNPDNPNEPAGVCPPEVFVEHAANDPEKRLLALRDRNLPLLERAVREATSDRMRGRFLFHLAETYEALADAAPKNEPGGEFISLTCAAMGAYMRRMELGGSREEVNLAHFGYLNAAASLNFYSDEELLQRLGDLAREDPRPEVLYLLAVKEKLPLDGYRAAVAAAEAARQAKAASPTIAPRDESILWRSLRLAAERARQIGMEAHALRLAEAGLRAGGPQEAFNQFQGV